jgi:hypothetical protein
MNIRLRIGAIMLVTTVSVAGCSGNIMTQSEISPGPVGIGRSINDLKGTPCACTEIEMNIPQEMWT